MTHEDIKILISAYIDGEVTPSEKNIVEEHLSSCTFCQQDYKKYMAMSSSLSKWSDETLSPDETINVQRSFEQRREPMFTKRTVMALGTILALTLIIGSVLQVQLKKGQIQGQLKSAASNIGDQYSDANTANLKSTVYEPVYQSSNYDVQKKQLGVVLQRKAFSMPATAALKMPGYAVLSSGKDARFNGNLNNANTEFFVANLGTRQNNMLRSGMVSYQLASTSGVMF